MLENVHKQVNDLTQAIDKKMEEGSYPKVKYTCELREGIPEEEILSYARHENHLLS